MLCFPRVQPEFTQAPKVYLWNGACYLIGVNMSVGIKQRSLPADWVLVIWLKRKTSESTRWPFPPQNNSYHGKGIYFVRNPSQRRPPYSATSQIYSIVYVLSEANTDIMTSTDFCIKQYKKINHRRVCPVNVTLDKLYTRLGLW